jgi:hypothetical protein
MLFVLRQNEYPRNSSANFSIRELLSNDIAIPAAPDLFEKQHRDTARSSVAPRLNKGGSSLV